MLQTNAIASINSLLLQLPESLQVEALHYVEYLSSSRVGKTVENPNQMPLDPAEVPSITRKRNGFGILKGKILIADDFDAPLEEFSDYQ
ncbi:MAG: hypothetical protein RLZZ511_3277 [Cyanobacteriota bacterium]|jgi:hypothetical protein